MSLRKKGDLSEVLNRVAGKRNYYWIFGVDYEQPDATTAPEHVKRPWVVNFGVSTDRSDLDAKYDGRNKLADKDLHDLLSHYYKDAANPPRFELEVSKNWHTARAATKQEAEQLASEITYILRNAGIQPMDSDEAKFPAIIPGTNSVVAFTPPRSGR